MPLGRLASHLADLPRWVNIVMTREGVDLETENVDAPPAATTTEVLARFDDNVSAARSVLVDTIDGSLATSWTLTRGKQELFRLPRIGMLRYFVFNHLIHHRGQLSVYLRIRGVPIPAIYGPAETETAI